MSADEGEWPEVAVALARNWDFPVTGHKRLAGGRNARIWQVAGPAGLAVAKLVQPGDADLGHFEASLHVAVALDQPELPTAPPLFSRDARLVVPVGSGRLALLPRLAGRPLSGTSDADLDLMGTVLARLHRLASRVPVPEGLPAWPWSWLSLDALGLAPIEPGDGRLIERAACAAAGSHQLGLVHGDPTPDAFLLADGVTGVIDWASVMRGPLRYDLAVIAIAAERAGARPSQVARLVGSYDAASGTTAPEGLGAMRALRFAAEIVYFTARLRHPAGPPTAGEDLAGLARARAALREAGGMTDA